MHLLWVCALLGLVAPSVQPSVQADVTLTLQRAFERAGRHVPAEDPVLSRAAAALAQEALLHGAAHAADPRAVSHALSQAGGFDPSPRALVLRSGSPQRALESLRARTEVGADPATHFGVGVAQDRDQTVLVLVTAERKTQLEPFPRSLAEPGLTHTLCGELNPPLEHAEVYITRPSGPVDQIPLVRNAAHGFCSTLVFPADGEHSVEVLAHGPAGPEVAALFFVEVGRPLADAPQASQAEPRTLPEARRLLLEQINRLRDTNQEARLHPNDVLNSVAQAYSERMAREHFFAHVAPDGETLTLRLGRAGFVYRRAGENLGLASGALAAHAGIEQSPGHRRNLLEADFDQVGIGVATEQMAGGSAQVVVTELFATPPGSAEGAVSAIHHALIKRRAQLHLPPLERTPALDQLALERARQMMQRGAPEPDAPHSPLQQRIFSLIPDAQDTSTDQFVSDAAGFIPDSQSLRRKNNRRVGVGAVKGLAPSATREQYWVVVIYTGSP